MKPGSDPRRFLTGLLCLVALTACKAGYYLEPPVGQSQRVSVMESVEACRRAQEALQVALEACLVALDEDGAAARRGYDAILAVEARLTAENSALAEQAPLALASWSQDIQDLDVDQLRREERERLAEVRTRIAQLQEKLEEVGASLPSFFQDVRRRVYELEATQAGRRVFEKVPEPSLRDQATRISALAQAAIDEVDEYLAAERRG